MSGTLEKVARGLDVVVEACGWLAAWTGLALVLVMAGNVLMRYAFNTGSVGMQELEWHLMSPLTLLCIAYTIKHEGHVRVDILYARFPLRLRQAIDLFSALSVVVLSVIVIVLSWRYVMQSYRIGEGSPDPGGLPYRFILKAMIPAGFLLLLFQSLAATLRALIPFLGGQAQPPAQVPSHAPQ
ncbi:TRAP transporter small permease subunit [Ancylobacter dichloromethanicus]|uniref:TRAP transporter small permease protein n=1 Tax=Ancylobacter dichloromethanicus TaxID=518825 RepID=A0A9W6JAN8_9HYPH|nr:TRAP transporter small permease subunit [Ancylobacter dichloromethanicus]MBS7553144.1 TRAP transporter small permease subunit [Ancylobacter dichloromethanicus]GLK72921.1 C4-dicarboxylate ABC transporter substrate-binding protein [Ancylobacter dichloromethanicus]